MDVSKVLSNITGSKEHEQYYGGFSSYFGPIDPNTSLIETVKAVSRKHRQYDAQRFWTGGCTFDSVHKTCVPSRGIFSWLDNSYAITWVAVHGVDDAICVVTRHNDLDITRLGRCYMTWLKHDVMYALTEAIVSEVEGLPYDDEFCKRSGQSIKKPFGVVSAIPVTEKSHEVTGQLASSVEYDNTKAINFLMEKMKSESAITLDETIKTAISAFQHLCLQELEAEELWVTVFKGHGLAEHLPVHEIEEHLAVINSGAGKSDSGSSGSTNNENVL